MQQSELPKPEGSHSESYKPEEFTEFLQENWIYLAFVLVIIYIVVMYSKILRDRKRNREE
ncbi:hypothetical protein G3567_12750 [Psychroflexus sp. YR1-1]|uniref:Uncharacterized protein n=1 Tax=Psychroflexus aurantiacus TaxID=2709310 RepID=A0A6B3R718_9FLAO|nr:hypothetical protein [Psychroflexus aurantiacus]NEV95005.1 hypothetical protein [Psychroflexus aurantiacus]